MIKLQKDSIKILVTDDHLVIQRGLGMIVKDVVHQAILFYANSLRATLDVLKNEHIDMLFLDINIPGGNNFQMIESIRAIHPDIKILIFSAFSAETYALRYFKSGVNGYLEKSAQEDEIRKAITSIWLKGRYLSAKVQDLLLEANQPGQYAKSSLLQLTNRELEIARLLAKGEGTNSIGHILDLRVSTISTHKKNIFDKLKISSISGLITEFKLDNES